MFRIAFSRPRDRAHWDGRLRRRGTGRAGREGRWTRRTREAVNSLQRCCVLSELAANLSVDKVGLFNNGNIEHVNGSTLRLAEEFEHLGEKLRNVGDIGTAGHGTSAEFGNSTGLLVVHHAEIADGHLTLELLERGGATRQLELPGEHSALLDVEVLDGIVEADNLISTVGTHDVSAESGEGDVVLAVAKEAVQDIVDTILRITELTKNLERGSVVLVITTVLGRGDGAAENSLHLSGTVSKTGHVGVKRDLTRLESDRGGRLALKRSKLTEGLDHLSTSGARDERGALDVLVEQREQEGVFTVDAIARGLQGDNLVEVTIGLEAEFKNDISLAGELRLDVVVLEKEGSKNIALVNLEATRVCLEQLVERCDGGLHLQADGRVDAVAEEVLSELAQTDGRELGVLGVSHLDGVADDVLESGGDTATQAGQDLESLTVGSSGLRRVSMSSLITACMRKLWS